MKPPMTKPPTEQQIVSEQAHARTDTLELLTAAEEETQAALGVRLTAQELEEAERMYRLLAFECNKRLSGVRITRWTFDDYDQRYVISARDHNGRQLRVEYQHRTPLANRGKDGMVREVVDIICNKLTEARNSPLILPSTVIR